MILINLLRILKLVEMGLYMCCVYLCAGWDRVSTEEVNVDETELLHRETSQSSETSHLREWQ